MPKRTYDAIFISPHLDDAVLSAGNRIKTLTSAGKKVAVVTVFTAGSSVQQQSAHAFLTQCGITDYQTLFRSRIHEDQLALQQHNSDSIYFGLIDASFRPDHPTHKQVFKTKVTHADQTVIATITQKITQLVPTIAKQHCHIFAPLGVGNHIDHEIVYEACCQAWQPTKPWSLSFWEDVPYRHQTGATNIRLAQLASRINGLRAEIIYTRNAQAKNKAIRQYVSQLPGLTNGGGYCESYDKHIECFWHA